MDLCFRKMKLFDKEDLLSILFFLFWGCLNTVVCVYQRVIRCAFFIFQEIEFDDSLVALRIRDALTFLQKQRVLLL